MGRAKAWQMEQWERGFKWVADKHVCDECVDDLALRAHINANAGATACSYCGRTADEPIACELDTLLGAIADGIAVDWDDAENFMPYEGDDWALPDVNRHIYDLLADGELEIDVPAELFDDIVEAFADRTFAPRDYFGVGPYERLHFGWDAFVRQVTHHTRYLFMQVPADDEKYAGAGEIPPAKMLSEIGGLVAEAGLVRGLPVGVMLYRGRLHRRATGERPCSAKSLGAPPPELALVSNRMSPNGIPMFYGAFDPATAQAETTAAGWEADRDLTLAEFVSVRVLNVVDLTKLPPVPSLYDEAERSNRPSLAFLDRFASEVKKPINRDEREHLEYVPTQIATEYFRHAFEAEHGTALDGIVYGSATNAEGRCIVLFIGNNESRDIDDEDVDTALVLLRAFSMVPARV